MPVKVYGTGGGKNTKDATALPDDVRAGKTFYNADGKQEGIWTPQVTDYTGDADALPENVLLGKTFYNADGKQVGTLVEKIYSDFVFDADAQPSDVVNGKVFYNNEGKQIGDGKLVKYMEITTGNDSLGNTSMIGLYMGKDMYLPSYGYIRKYFATLNLVGTLVGFEYNGIYNPIPFGNFDGAVALGDYTISASKSNVLLVINNNELFFAIANANYKIYYVD